MAGLEIIRVISNVGRSVVPSVIVVAVWWLIRLRSRERKIWNGTIDRMVHRYFIFAPQHDFYP